MNRRELLGVFAGAALTCGKASAAEQKKIATVITEYRRNSHADVIVGRLLDGYEYNGQKRTPRVQVVSMYTDQVPANDMSRGMASKHGFKIFPTVRETLLRGTGKLAVEGVVLVGEHGNYPTNEKGQTLYPRYELYKQIMDVFRETRRTVPVFCDKHLSTEWEKAKWMYDQSRELMFPFMAGSSLPLWWRHPPLELGLEAPVERSVGVYYGPKDAYGFHALEAHQCMVERRKGGETGIAAVQCLEGPEVWKWTDQNRWAARLLDQGLARCENRKPGAARDNVKKPIVFLLEYRSGLRSAVYILDGHVKDAAFAADIQDKSEPVSTEFWAQPVRPFSHFSGLVYYIEQMIVTGHPAYPVERTLLTTGALTAAMDSSYRGNKRLETPHLDVMYRAQRASLFSQGPVPAPSSEPI